MTTTAYHAKYFAHELTRRRAASDPASLTMALCDACVDLTPHQVDAAIFALRNPLSKGVLLADEVGLGKTIEAGLLLCQHWAERKRRLLVICPASIRKQWAIELREKFNLPATVLDKKTYSEEQALGKQPLRESRVAIMSFHLASRFREEIAVAPLDLVIIDEAHKLRNCYQASNSMGRNIKAALSDKRKVLLTATPLQNSLVELYGLSTLLDDTLFGDEESFKAMYGHGQDSDALHKLKERLALFCHRTRRRQVTEYINYTERRPLTFDFDPTADEQRLYEGVSSYLQRDHSFALPKGQRTLLTLIVRKLLASSSRAVAATLERIRGRALSLLEGIPPEEELAADVIADEDMEDDLLEETAGDTTAPASNTVKPETIRRELQEEIDTLTALQELATSITADAKSMALLPALDAGFRHMESVGAARKALIFTESRRTQEYLHNFLESHGHKGRVVSFNGTNADEHSRRIYSDWYAAHAGTSRVSASRAIDTRTALIEHFRDTAEIMIATEAASEGVNLQFCSLVVNYDLPWNPQRVEQRIGRCHRYGQKHDVVVVNFSNTANEADRLVLALLAEKYKLFAGVFGASDEILGAVASGLDVERAILEIYQQCRTPDAIKEAFRKLQDENKEPISQRMRQVRSTLLEQFDDEVKERLRGCHGDAQATLGKATRRLWALTQHALAEHARFDAEGYTFDLRRSPATTIPVGRYRLIHKGDEGDASSHLYRLSHPLCEWALAQARDAHLPLATLTFDITNSLSVISEVARRKGQSGWLALTAVSLRSFSSEKHLVFAAYTDDGDRLDDEACDKLFQCEASVAPLEKMPAEVSHLLESIRKDSVHAAIEQVKSANAEAFKGECLRLDNWVEDRVFVAERELKEIRDAIRGAQKRIGSGTIEEQRATLAEIQNLEKEKRRCRTKLETLEDEASAKRAEIIQHLSDQLNPQCHVEELFTACWRVS
jgi:superfamily II DNA or RNA helicase